MVLPTNKVLHAVGHGLPPWELGGEPVAALPMIAGGAVLQTLIPTLAPTPWREDDFDSYTSISNFLADPRGIYTSEDEITSQMSLVQPGYNGSANAYRVTFPDRSGSCSDYTVQRNLSFPANVDEVWVEFAARFSANFETVAAGCGGSSNPDFKFVFVRTLPDSRFSWKNGTNGTHWDPTPPTHGDGTYNYIDPDGLLWDGQWHLYRLHCKNSSDQFTADGRMRGMIDGVEKFDLANIVVYNNSGGGAITDLYGLKMYGNMNQGPDEICTVDMGLVRLYNSDPGWSWT